MHCITLFLLISLISNGVCTFNNVFEEWAKIKEEPAPGYGPFELVPLFVGTCDPTYEVDPNVWINATIKLDKKNDYYNVDVDLVYPENVLLQMVRTEFWGKKNKTITRILKSEIKNPCKKSMLNIALKILKFIPPCTIQKGHYKFLYEDIGKMISAMMKYMAYMRVIWKLEYFSEKGQFGCNLIVSDVQKKENN